MCTELLVLLIRGHLSQHVKNSCGRFYYRARTKQPQRLTQRGGLQYEENFDADGSHGVVTPQWQDVTMRVCVQNAAHRWQAEKQVAGIWSVGDAQQLSLNCNLQVESVEEAPVSIKVSTAKGGSYPVRFGSSRFLVVQV